MSRQHVKTTLPLLNRRREQELIRKRRHNLFKRLTEFNGRYKIDIWMAMRMPSRRIYTFTTEEDAVWPKEIGARIQGLPITRKTPADYIAKWTAKESSKPIISRQAQQQDEGLAASCEAQETSKRCMREATSNQHRPLEDQGALGAAVRLSQDAPLNWNFRGLLSFIASVGI
ncbi:hypothetical protein N7537_011440 [Penicillium hordei]|uniref:Uncharacterized protein n=1 Tax=Penicillium hordei TaxID=40994 RepID=A0AAD6DN52_9EURO|nr:uncharacterized protein N7537_011440 [Penicillium hordei]KAJ5588762.1 hypothetical protein N7537_011440 [Penicillium hordei]